MLNPEDELLEKFRCIKFVPLTVLFAKDNDKWLAIEMLLFT